MKRCVTMESLFNKLSKSLILLIALIQINGYKACLETERLALLELKTFFISVSGPKFAEEILTLWVDDDPFSDCCGWERVKCNATTGRVIELSLYETRPLNAGGSPLLNLSLFLPFEELQNLDLSFNFFEGVYENKAYDSLGSLKQLKILNLNYNKFNDSLLSYLNTLTSLTTLTLVYNKIEGLKPIQGLINLRNLLVLNLKGNYNMTSGSLTKLGLTNLTNLKRLELGYCGLTTIQELTNLKNLQVLNLNDNNISLIRIELRNLTSLQRLELSYCGLTTIQGIANLTNLKVLDIRGNRINEPITRLGKFRNLRALDLRANVVKGSLESHGVCELWNLFELDLSENNFESHLPQCLNKLTHFKILDISSNQLNGNLPSVLSNITSLEYLSLSNNNFEGTFSFSSLANNLNLQIFILSRNNMLQVKTENWLPPWQLKALYLTNCNLKAIPSFLLHQYHLRYLDLSHNKLVDNFPTWLLQNNSRLEILHLANNSFTGILPLPNVKHDLLHLDISNNCFTGKLPHKMGIVLQKLIFLNMSKNIFEGEIPYSIGEMKELVLLDLSINDFLGKFPATFLAGCVSLRFLDLSNNKFYGQIFPKYMNLTQLYLLYLDNNHFSGKIDDGLIRSTFLVVLDISNNKLSGDIPSWMGNFSPSLRFLLMSKNNLKGNIPSQLSNLESLEILDVSENCLSGYMRPSLNPSSLEHLYMQKNAFNGLIPNTLFRNSNLLTLDLRDNNFSGQIPRQINRLSNLRVMFLRKNYLQGSIPNQLCELQELGIMDLSHNKLNGSMPSCFTNVSFWRVGKGYLYGGDLELVMGVGVGSVSTFYNSNLDFYLPSAQGSVQGSAQGIAIIFQHVKVELVTKNRYEFYNGSNLDYMSGLDLSCNELSGEIPTEIGELRNIHELNLSHNFLSCIIPESFSGLKMIESLDLSHNKLSGRIPPQLVELNFLSTFNVSYNNLSGPIPDKQQFTTFDKTSYGGNPNLCGLTINKSCRRTEEIPATTSNWGEEDESAIDMVAFKWSFGASYVTFILALFAILWLNSYWRWLWFYFIEACIDWCFYWLEKFVYYICGRVRP